MTAHKRYKVTVDTLPQDYPKDFEMRAAEIIAQYFQTDVVFMRVRGSGNTADLNIKGVHWEIKSPTGNSKRTIENNLKEAHKQSSKIVLDLGRTDMPFLRARSRARYYLKTYAKYISEVLIITKGGQVVPIYKRK
ncbi:hypothetical protein IJI55_02455 [Candidatus Saccharibacteria bacterium]|nr:hypothetical protein [Candidatus Saccharibacteria bacterium]